MQNIFPVTGKIFSSPYDWGGSKLIPQTLGFTPEPGVPYAEYWLGVHKKAPSLVQLQDGTTDTLDHLIEQNKESILGKTAIQQFGTLPFLFKLLDAGEMLSIQVHPDKKQAEEGFALEEKAGIPIDDPKRTYKDTNQKSEYAVALDDFWLLHGFRTTESILNILNEIKELSPLILHFKNDDYHSLYKYVMQDLSSQDANEILDNLAKRILPLFEANQLPKTNPDYWAAKAIIYMQMSKGNYDRGLFSIYLLNLVNLKPGQAIYQENGLLHAYLEGPIIEVMTNSDNVARGGITPKYVDIEALMKFVKFKGITPNIIEGRKAESEIFFDVPLKEFLVSRINTTTDYPYTNKTISAELLMGMQGDAVITADNQKNSVGKGKSVIITANTHYEISGNQNDIIYRISIPLE